MKRIAIALVLGALLAVVPAASAQTGDPAHDQAVALGDQAYRYGFPLMEFLRVRDQETSVPAPDRKGNSPVNVFSNADKFARPSDRTVVAPNVDTLYSITHLDLGKGPIVIEHPNLGNRYFTFELVDPWTNVIGYVGSRTTGARARQVRRRLVEEAGQARARRPHHHLAVPARVGHRPDADRRHAR